MNRNEFRYVFLTLVFACIAVVPAEVALGQAPEEKVEAVATTSPDQNVVKEKDKSDGKKWQALTGKWSKCEFGGDGPIEINDKLLSLGMGDPITGLKWEGDVLRDNYEIELEARRVEGFDFFCAITMPIAKDHISLVLGGWGGGVVGISSIDDRDASDNETTMFRNFDNGKWYKVRVRIEQSRLVVWLDDVLMFEHDRKDHRFDIRFEMDLCTPLGLANYQCKSEIRNCRVRPLAKDELGVDLSTISKKASDK